MKLSTRAMLVYSFIVSYKIKHDGNSPTYEVMRRHLGYGSKATIHHHIKQLEDIGAIRVDEGAIELGGKYSPPLNIGVNDD